MPNWEKGRAGEVPPQTVVMPSVLQKWIHFGCGTPPPSRGCGRGRFLVWAQRSGSNPRVLSSSLFLLPSPHFFFFLLISAIVFLSDSTVTITVIVMGPQTLPEGPPAAWGASLGLGMHSGRRRKVPLTSELSACRERWAVKEALSSHLPQMCVCDFRRRYTAGGLLRDRVGGDGGQPGREVALLALGHRGVMAAGVTFCPPPPHLPPVGLQGPIFRAFWVGVLSPWKAGALVWLRETRPRMSL